MRITLIAFLTLLLFSLPLYSEDLGVISGEVSFTNGDYATNAEVTLTPLTPGRDPCGGGGGGRGGGDGGGDDDGGDGDGGGGCGGRGGGGCGGDGCGCGDCDCCDCEGDCDDDCDCGCEGRGCCCGDDCGDCDDDCDCDCKRGGGCGGGGCGGGGCGDEDCDCGDDCDGEDCDCGCHDGCGGRRGGGGCGGGCHDGDKKDGDCGCGCGNGCGGGCEDGCGCDCDKKTQSDDRGRFEYGCIAEGEYRVTVVSDGVTPFEDVIYIEGDDQAFLEITLERGNQLDIGEVSVSPVNISLLSSYPNPFNSTATVSIVLSQSDWVEASLYNLSGQKLLTLHQGFLSVGHHRMSISGADLSTGTYLIKLNTSAGIESQVIQLIK